MLTIGVDIHKLKHEIAIVNESGNLCGKSFKIKNSYEGLALLYQRIARVNPNNTDLCDGGHRTLLVSVTQSSAG